MPLPPATFGIFEPTFDPGAHAVPHDSGCLGSQIGDDEPRLCIGLVPTGQQRTLQPARSSCKTVGDSTPPRPHLRHQAREPAKTALPRRTHLAGAINAQERMPLEGHEMLVE